MSIVIQGLFLPKDRELRLRIDENGEVYVYGSYPTELHKAVDLDFHGRLIDADVLTSYLYEQAELVADSFKNEESDFSLKVGTAALNALAAFIQFVKDSKTIIPADILY